MAPMTVEEAGRLGGKVTSDKKRAASARNLALARAIRTERCRLARKQWADKIREGRERLGLPTVTQQGAVVLVEKK